MGRVEDARVQLESLKSPDWRDSRSAAAKDLPAALRTVARALLQCEPDGRYNPTYSVYDAAQKLEKLSQDERKMVFDIIFPQLKRYIERAWTDPRRSPDNGLLFRSPYVANPQSVFWIVHVIQSLVSYDFDIVQLATWAPYFSGSGTSFATLFAAAIDLGHEVQDEQGNIVFAILTGQEPYRARIMGRYAIHALLMSARPDAWDYLEQQLLNARRDEGFRQSVLEPMIGAHPGAFRRILRLIVQYDLTRFSSVIRACNQWFHLEFETTDASSVKPLLEKVLAYLDGATADALATGDGQSVYLALWAVAFDNMQDAIVRAKVLLNDKEVERRFAAVKLISTTMVPEAQPLLLAALHDDDMRVVVQALQNISANGITPETGREFFAQLEQLAPRFKNAKPLQPILWPWIKLSVNPAEFSNRLFLPRGNRSVRELLPYLSMLEESQQQTLAAQLIQEDAASVEGRKLAFKLAQSRQKHTRASALNLLSNLIYSSTEVADLEALLISKHDDVRQGILKILFKRPDLAAIAQRLVASADQHQRLASLEMLHFLIKERRAVEQCTALIKEYSAAHPDLTPEEQHLIHLISMDAQEYSLDNALGLVPDPAARTGVHVPQPQADWFAQPAAILSSADLIDRLASNPQQAIANPAKRALPPSLIEDCAFQLIASLEDAIEANRDIALDYKDQWGNRRQGRLGSSDLWFPIQYPEHQTSTYVPQPEATSIDIPLESLWQSWWRELPAALADEVLLVQAVAIAQIRQQHVGKLPNEWGSAETQFILLGTIANCTIHHARIVLGVLQHLMAKHASAQVVDYLLNAVETAFALIPDDQAQWQPVEARKPSHRSYQISLNWLGVARKHRRLCPQAWNNEQLARFWSLLRWLDQPYEGAIRIFPQLNEVLDAFRTGAASPADVYYHLVGPRAGHLQPHYFHDLRQITSKDVVDVSQYPGLKDIVARTRQRIIDIELSRSELPGLTTHLAIILQSSGGIATLIPLLAALGTEKVMSRKPSGDFDVRRVTVLRHLILVSSPDDGDTPLKFAKQAKAAGISESRLLELAVAAPQWAAYVARVVKWPRLEEAIWWLYSHARHAQYTPDMRWKAASKPFATLTEQQLEDGATDIVWLKRVHKALGKQRWNRLCDIRRAVVRGSRNRQTRLTADAILGRLRKDDLLPHLAKHESHYLRIFALLPIANDADTVDRYLTIQQYAALKPTFGAYHLAKDELAVSTALDNLARTAGYASTDRLRWAMELHNMAALLESSGAITVGEVTIALSVNDYGEVELSASKRGKPLKAIPAKLRTRPEVIALKTRRRELVQHSHRVIALLERAMCDGTPFTAQELQALSRNIVIGPLLASLIFIGDGALGYPDDSGSALRSYDGKLTAINEAQSYRIAHPYDLLTANHWEFWQRECFLAERIQPFKQIFRELYVITDVERTAEGLASHRYEGQQLHNQKASRLFRQAGWLDKQGTISRYFYGENVVASAHFNHAFTTPGDVEGAILETVSFSTRDTDKPIPLAEVPPRLFSEVMRDIDHIVTTAHQSGTDPESTASTIDMRIALIREACELLKIDNVAVRDLNAEIQGQLAAYTVHLGSAVVHMQPGNGLCIVPVHAQHRGRLFLPFANDDPRAAEILSKVILLARDNEIQDPTILNQIMHH